MAYAIFNNFGDYCKLAENETQKNNLNLPVELYDFQSITSEQFTTLKKDRGIASVNNGVVSIIERPSFIYTNEESLRNYHKAIIDVIEEFLKHNSTSHPMYTACNDYKTVLKSFDYSTITPANDAYLDKNWEEYCDENSITYLNLLQIP